jgi:hypothetical protein
LPLQLQELVAQGFCPVRHPAIPGPQGLSEGIESVPLLPELAELNAHLVEGAVPVTGTELQLLPPVDKIHEYRIAKKNAKMTRARKKATATYLEDTPRRAAVDLQRLIQRPVERSGMAGQLLPQLLLLLGVGEEGGGRIDVLFPLPRPRRWIARARGAAWDEEASTPCLEPPATMWPSHRLTSTPA